jgi:predicted HTH domain antitoxin
MASIARKIKRGQFEKVENKLTGNVELFRKGRHSLVFTG